MLWDSPAEILQVGEAFEASADYSAKA